MTEFKPIVSMVTLNGVVIVAMPDGVYKIVDGKPVLIADQEDFRRADEEWAKKRDINRVTIISPGNGYTSEPSYNPFPDKVTKE